MLNDLIPLTLVAMSVPLVALVVFRLLAKTNRTRRPLNNFRIGNDPSAKPSRLSH